MKRLLLLSPITGASIDFEATRLILKKERVTHIEIVVRFSLSIVGVQKHLSLITGVTFRRKKLQSVIGRAVDSLVTCEQMTLGTRALGG